MAGNPYRWRATIAQLENRNATAGCLLTVLFAVPYLAKYGQFGTLSLTLLVFSYVTLVVPLLTGIMSRKTLVFYMRNFVAALTDTESWANFLRLIFFILQWSHFIYLQLKGVHITTMQVVFNMAAERLLCPDDKLCSLYVLLFYTVIAYVQRSLQNRPWTHLLTENSTAEFLKLTTAFMIVRLGKAVAMSLILITFSLQFNRMEPSVNFVGVTFFYFCVTQYQNHKFVLKCITEWLSWLQLQCLEAMEDLWVPFLVNCVAISVSVFLGISCLLKTDCYIILLLFSYTNILVPFVQMLETTWAPLSKEIQKISKFPLATWKNPEIRSGGLCAICLDKLRLLSARVTSCGHTFHGACLRRSMLYSSRCPLCKTSLTNHKQAW